MRTYFSKLIILLTVIIGSVDVKSQNTPESNCIQKFETFIKNIKSHEGNYDSEVNDYYNLFYFNVNSNVPSDKRNYFDNNSTFQIDENSGLVFLINESKPKSYSNTQRYYLKIFHPIAGPLQFYFDDINGSLYLPKQNKKVSITSRNYSSDYGFTLLVTIDNERKTITTEIEDKYERCCNLPNLGFLFENESKLTGLNDYPIGSNLNTFYGTMRVLDPYKTKEFDVKYYPTYEEKLAVFRTGSMPKQDLENPDFYIIKKQQKEVYKNEVYGRKGIRHYLNDCFDELEASFSNYLIFKRNNKYGILDTRLSILKSGNYILTKNLYDKIEWITGTETFSVIQNNEKFIIDVNGNKIN
jgi:hypothetical protein